MVSIKFLCTLTDCTFDVYANDVCVVQELPTDDFSKGVVFYLEEGEPRRIVGVLTWNLFGKMELAKQVCLWVHVVMCCVCDTLCVQVIADGRREADIGEIAANFQLHN